MVFVVQFLCFGNLEFIQLCKFNKRDNLEVTNFLWTAPAPEIISEKCYFSALITKSTVNDEQNSDIKVSFL